MSAPRTGSSETSCCDRCLRRAVLVGALAPLIERVSADLPGQRTPELLALSDAELASAVAPNQATDLLDATRARALGALRRELGEIDAWASCVHDEGYPEALRAAGGQAPAALLGRGDPSRLALLDAESSVTVVGSRRPSRYGIEVARKLGLELAATGLTVISGMAIGIDSEALRGALDGAGAVAAVLGSGPDVCHPASRRVLYEEIVRGGLVLSELPPRTHPYRWTFPARNRIMAALGGMTVVVEAAERSGSLITARMAIDLGRDLGAVPGRVGEPLAAGTNGLLAEGAAVIRGAQDVLDAVLGPGAPRIEHRAQALSPTEAEVLELVGCGHGTADGVASASGLAVADATAALASLELAGRLRCDDAGRYTVAP